VADNICQLDIYLLLVHVSGKWAILVCIVEFWLDSKVELFVFSFGSSWLGHVCLLTFRFRPAGAISYHYLLCCTVINLKVLNVQDLSQTLPLILKG